MSGGRSSSERDPRLVVSGRMGRNNLKGNRPSVCARIFRWGLLVAFVACFLPIPVRPITSPETGSENYPCKGNLCGCRTAQQCWTSCCCTTPEERLAWAIENNVTPPVYAVLSSDRSAEPSITSNQSSHHFNNGSDSTDKSSCPHCSNIPKSITLIESETYCGSVQTKSLVNSHTHDAKENEPNTASLAMCDSKDSSTSASKSRNKPPKIRFVRVIDTLKCHGLTFALDLINQCVIPELRAVTTSIELEESLIDTIRIPYPVYLAVSIPPPRI